MLYRRLGGLDAFLTPHNGHPSLVPVAAYRALFAWFGADTYAPYRVLGVGLHVATAAMLFRYGRRRSHPVAALVAAGVLLVLGSAWEVLLWPFTVFTFAVPALALLGALSLLDADSRRGDAAASGVVGLALASSGAGLAAAAGVGLDLALRRQWRRLWVLAVPGAAYAVWFATARDSVSLLETIDEIPGSLPVAAVGAGPAAVGSLAAVPGYVGRAAASAAGGLGGVGPVPGWIVLGLAAAAFAAVYARRRAFPSARVVALLSAALVFWGLAGVTRAGVGSPDASRYVYLGGAILLAAGLEVIGPARLGRWVVVAGVVGGLAAVALNVRLLIDAGVVFRQRSDVVRAELAAVELARDGIDPGFVPDAGLMPTLTAGPYLRAATALGSPAFAPGELAAAPAEARRAADAVLLALSAFERHTGVPLGDPVDPGEVERAEGTTDARGHCRSFAPRPGGGRLFLEVAAPVLRVDPAPGGVAVRVRRFAPDFRPLHPLPSGTFVLRLAGGSAPERWRVVLGTAGPVVVCGFAGPDDE